MTERRARIAVPEAEPELEIVALSICRSLQERGADSALAIDDVGTLAISSGARTVSLRWDSARGTLADRDWPLVLHPAVHPGLLPEPPLSRTRLTFRADADSRRQRMIERTVRELRRRGFDGPVAAAGQEECDWADEWFPALGGLETLRLLASSRAIVDACSDADPPHLFTRIAIACGYPVVMSASRAQRRSEGVKEVQEWSADAFADAILSEPPAERRADVAGIEALVDEVEKAFQLG